MGRESRERRVLQIAIDGPVGAGKSSVARLVAQRLGWLYVDTGAMYRAAALIALRKEIPLRDGAAVARLVREAAFEMRNPEGEERDGRLTTLLINGEDVSWKIRTEEVSRAASITATHKEVREELVRKQQELASKAQVVMEGRDITFRVLPDANLKIFLTASEEERARRRQRQLQERGRDVDYQEVLLDLQRRDARDSRRTVDPLQVVPDAWVLDTTNLTISETVERILGRVDDLLMSED